MKLLTIVLALGIWNAASAQTRVPAIAGAPFSADQVQQGPMSSSVIGHFFRDSAGRTRTESALITGGWRIEIVDPVSGLAYALDDKRKIAHRVVRRQPAAEASAISTDAGESLGQQTISGLVATGTRVGGAMGIEIWESVELKVTLQSKSSNGYSGWLTNISRDEPDPNLFRVPADYQVVEN